MRRFYFQSFLLLALAGLGFAKSARAAEECASFARLVPAFAAEFSLDAKKAKIQFTPLNLALDLRAGERPGYLLSDQESCGIRGDCDSLVYLGDAHGCYRPVLTFRGKWKGLDRKQGRELASLEIESRIEGDAAKGRSVLRIERQRRRFEYVPSSDRYEEKR